MVLFNNVDVCIFGEFGVFFNGVINFEFFVVGLNNFSEMFYVWCKIWFVKVIIIDFIIFVDKKKM